MDLEQSRSRRRAQDQQVRRRRRGVVGALALAVLAVVALVIALGGSSGGSGAPASAGGSGSGRSSGSGAARPTAAAGGAATSGLPPATPPADAAGGPPGHVAVPILTYHVINPPPPGAAFPGLYVTPSEFAAQMRGLAAAGWHAVTLDQLWAHWQRGVPLPAGKPVVLTFDNGYESQYTHARPVLRALHWQADLNVQLTGLPPSQGGLSARQVRGLVDAGWELDTQGISHADLITLGAAQLHAQVAGARQRLQARYHVPVNWFCYPSGHYDSTVIAAVRDAGFVGSTTVDTGWSRPSNDPYRLPRIRVLGGTSPGQLLANIADARNDPPPGPSYGGA
jgi:peptidoglycan/xylan/chitin deacetylase (PgdA/CDA1 family)